MDESSFKYPQAVCELIYKIWEIKKKTNLKNYISYVLVFFYMRQKEACWCHLHEIKNKFILMIFKLTAVIHASLKL